MIVPAMPAPAPIRISKSKFVAGVQCLKRLYFQIHQPELAEEADDLGAAFKDYLKGIDLR